MIRYHSFYAWHSQRAYSHLTCAEDREMLQWVQDFNTFDLYSKADAPPDIAALRPHYQALIDAFFPRKLRW